MNSTAALFWLGWGLIGFTYLLFPLILAFLAKRRPLSLTSQISEAALPAVVMVVAAFNERAVLEAKLANFRDLDYPSHLLTLLIGSDGSDDGTDAFLQSQASSRISPVLFAKRRGKISVLNDLFARLNEGTDPPAIVVMSDANTLYASDAIRRLVAPFASPEIGCVSGELTLEADGGVSGEGIYWKYEGWIKRSESRMGFLIGCNGGIFALRRELFEPLPASTIVEDFVLTLRILERGHRVVFVPEARATEPAAPSSTAEMIRKIRIGAGGFQALGLNRALLHPRFGLKSFAFWGHKVLRWFVPHAYLLALAANLLLLPRPGYAVWLFVQGLGVTIALLTAAIEKKRTPPKWMRPIGYFFLMNYALWRGFLRFLFRTQRVTWDKAASSD